MQKPTQVEGLVPQSKSVGDSGNENVPNGGLEGHSKPGQKEKHVFEEQTNYVSRSTIITVGTYP
jgi:hypothetical protein